MKKVQIAADLSMNKCLKTSRPSGFALWYPTSSNKHHKLERYCLSCWAIDIHCHGYTHMGVAIQPLEIPQSLGIQTCLARFQDANVQIDLPRVLTVPWYCDNGTPIPKNYSNTHRNDTDTELVRRVLLLKRNNSAGSGIHNVFPCLAWENWPIWSKKFENYHEIEWEINMSPIHVWPSTGGIPNFQTNTIIID